MSVDELVEAHSQAKKKEFELRMELRAALCHLRSQVSVAQSQRWQQQSEGMWVN